MRMKTTHKYRVSSKERPEMTKKTEALNADSLASTTLRYPFRKISRLPAAVHS